MAGLVPAIHALRPLHDVKTWMPGTRPGMTLGVTPPMTVTEAVGEAGLYYFAGKHNPFPTRPESR